MIPGPSEADPEVLPILSQQVVAHYGADWYQTYVDTLEKLKNVFKTNSEVIILPAPGSAGIEMAASNILEPGEKAGVVMNGFFGELAKFLIESYGGVGVPIQTDYGKPVDLDVVEQEFEQNDLKALFVVHSDTSSGVSNPVKELAAIANKHGALVVVDAVSSFAGMELEVDEWKIDFCVGYAGKALGGVVGATPIAIANSVWDRATKRKSRVPGRLLSLPCWKDAIDNWSSWGHPYPTTQPASIILAMRRALELALQEGLDNRYARHRKVAKALREAWKAMGLTIFPDERIASDTVSVLNVPRDTDSKIREIMYDTYNIMISKGLGKLSGRVIRIGHMGTSCSYGHVTQTIAALAGCLSMLGISNRGVEGLKVAVELLKDEP